MPTLIAIEPMGCGRIIHSMRHLVLALMIALLPIRGWIGDVMATEMASSRPAHLPSTTKMIADDAYVVGAGWHFDHESAPLEMAAAMPDCAGHGDAPAPAPAPAPAAHVSCDSCTACQACHTVALLPAGASAAHVLRTLLPPHSPVARFASADMAPGQKPPIS